MLFAKQKLFSVLFVFGRKLDGRDLSQALFYYHDTVVCLLLLLLLCSWKERICQVWAFIYSQLYVAALDTLWIIVSWNKSFLDLIDIFVKFLIKSYEVQTIEFTKVRCLNSETGYFKKKNL